MTRWRWALPILVLGAFPTQASAADEPDATLSALRDEIRRSMDGLSLPGSKKPYYVAFRLDDDDEVRVAGAFGALVNDDHSRRKMLHTMVRVGDYTVDSGNFAADRGVWSWRAMIPAFVPLESDYETVRRAAWLAADERYK